VKKVAVSWNDMLLDAKTHTQAIICGKKVAVFWNNRLLDIKAYTRAADCVKSHRILE
jgi:hypothetical protein